MYARKFSLSQVMPEFFIASEYLKPSTAPAERPITPLICGPTLFLAPGPTAWQGAHFLNAFFPASGSCAEATAGYAIIIQAVTIHLSISNPLVAREHRPPNTRARSTFSLPRFFCLHRPLCRCERARLTLSMARRHAQQSGGRRASLMMQRVCPHSDAVNRRAVRAADRGQERQKIESAL